MKSIFEKINRYFRGRWHLAVLDEAAGHWTVKPDPANIAYMKAQNANGRHVLLQPLPDAQPFYLLADDIAPELLRSHHRDKDGRWKPGRMIVETSPDNFQVWIHSRRFLPLEEKRHWLAKLRSDPGADPKNRWGRCPGFRNRKAKYRDCKGLYPLAKLIWIDWKNTARIPILSPPPRGGVCRKYRLSRNDYNRGDESATDFSYALALARRGYSNDEIAKRILEERPDWNNHKGDRRLRDYLSRTVSRARKIVEKT
jgi:hypothetical protein